MVVPNIGKAKKLLKYQPINSSLKNIIKTLDEWYEKRINVGIFIPVRLSSKRFPAKSYL